MVKNIVYSVMKKLNNKIVIFLEIINLLFERRVIRNFNTTTVKKRLNNKVD